MSWKLPWDIHGMCFCKMWDALRQTNTSMRIAIVNLESIPYTLAWFHSHVSLPVENDPFVDYLPIASRDLHIAMFHSQWAMKNIHGNRCNHCIYWFVTKQLDTDHTI